MGGARVVDACKIARERRADWPRTSFLAELDNQALRDFLTTGELAWFGKGDVLISEGDENNDVLLLLDACVKVTAQLDTGGQALLAIRVGGDVIGEIAVMSEGNRTATVSICGHRAVAAVRLSQDELHDLLSRYPDAHLSLTKAITRKLRAATQRRVDITGCPARVRMARAVLELAEDYGTAPATGGVLIGVNLNQKEIGTMVNLGQSLAQRTLRGLRKEGLVASFGRRLLVPDMTALRAAAWPN